MIKNDYLNDLSWKTNQQTKMRVTSYFERCTSQLLCYTFAYPLLES